MVAETFNYTLDVAALFIFASLFLVNSQQNFYKNRAYILFSYAWFVCVCISLSDIVSVISMDKGFVILFHISNMIYYLSQELAVYYFCKYVLAEVTSTKHHVGWKNFVFSIPLYIVTIIIVTNPWTKALFSYDPETKAYNYGNMQWVCYVVGLAYFGMSFFWCMYKKSLYNRRIRYAYLNSIVVGLAFFIYGINRMNVLTRGFITSLMIIQLFIVIMQEHPRQDPDTGLLSKKYFWERMHVLIQNKEKFNLLIIRVTDYDNFVHIFGKDYVALFKKEMCEKVRQYVPKHCGYNIKEDTIVLIIEKENISKIDSYADSLNKVLKQKWTAKDLDVSISHTIMTLKSFEDFSSEEELESIISYVGKAPRLMRGIAKFDDTEIKKIKREHEVEAVLKQNLDKNIFSMYYQPIYSPVERKFVAAEALIRMNNSSIGPISPAEFIPIAERAGLIKPIGYWIIESVFKFVSKTNLDIYGVQCIGVNLSTIQCTQSDLIPKLTKLQDKYHINPSKICFELAENMNLYASEIYEQNIKALKKAGYKLAIDDFGTGYGDFERLLSTEYDVIKYSKSTMESLCGEEKMKGLLGRLSGMMHGMKCSIVAEGVETKEQLDYVEIMGIDYIQGFYFSKALSEEDFLDFIRLKN